MTGAENTEYLLNSRLEKCGEVNPKQQCTEVEILVLKKLLLFFSSATSGLEGELKSAGCTAFIPFTAAQRNGFSSSSGE